MIILVVRDHMTSLLSHAKFNSEMEAMFCVRILPSLCGFPCGSNFCSKGLLVFAFKFASLLRDVLCFCNVSIIDLSKMICTWCHSKHSIIILVMKPMSITPVLSLARKAS